MSKGDNKNGCMHRIAFFIDIKKIEYDFLLVNKLVNHFLVLWGNCNICADRKISLINKINGLKFVRNQKVEFKKSFELYRQISRKEPNESWFKFCPVCIDESERNEAQERFMLITFTLWVQNNMRLEWVQKLWDLNESKNYAVKFWIVPKQKHEIMKWNQMG
jgi:hypothetical protein